MGGRRKKDELRGGKGAGRNTDRREIGWIKEIWKRRERIEERGGDTN
jgi:hypothetical protein